MRRLFTALQKRWLLQRQGYRCAICGIAIGMRTAHADHVVPFSKGGETSLSNAQALCASCNLSKSNKMELSSKSWVDLLHPSFMPHHWQADALNAFQQYVQRKSFAYGFTANVVQGAGKSVFCGMATQALTRAGLIKWAIILVPSSNLRDQTIRDSLEHLGIQLTTDAGNADRDLLRRQGVVGEVITYQYLHSNQDLYRRLFAESGELLVIRDEVHQLAEPDEDDEPKAWAAAVEHALGTAPYRISMSGTLFRSDSYRMHDIRYELQPDGSLLSVADFTYSMAEGIADGVIRRLQFHTTDAEVRWIDNQSEEQQVANLTSAELNKRDRARALQVAINPHQQFAQQQWRKAHEALSRDRANGIHDSAGLVVVASEADGLAMQSFIEKTTGCRPDFVLGREGDSDQRLKAFKSNGQPWLVTIRKAGQGYSARRIRHLVLLSNITTKNWFSQVACRTNRLVKLGEFGHVYIPAVPELVQFALEIERDVAHQVAAKAKAEERNREPAESDGDGGSPRVPTFQHVSSQSGDESVVVAGTQHGSELWNQACTVAAGLGDVTPEVAARVLMQAQQQQPAVSTAAAIPFDQQLQELRGQIDDQVRSLAALAKTKGLAVRDKGSHLKHVINSQALSNGQVRNDSIDIDALQRKLAYLQATAARLADLRSDRRVMQLQEVTQ